MIDSQIGKVKFGQKFKAGSKQAVVSVPYVIKVFEFFLSNKFALVKTLTQIRHYRTRS